MALFFWHNIISPHQAPFMRELAEARGEVVVVATEAMSESRRRLGWEVPSLGPARIILGPDYTQVLRIVEASHPESIHVLAGARGTPLGRQVALACGDSGRRAGIITETPDPRGFAGLLRFMKYAHERSTIGRRFDFILAMGQNGVRWFNRCGYPAQRIFPFAYVTDRLSTFKSGEGDNKMFRFLFVGQLIKRKGMDLLLRALAKVPSAELAVVGSGPEELGLKELALKLRVAMRVNWLGQMDAVRVQNQISKADVLILPSRHDGWGAVVNESLMAGTPVICSTACGASALVQHSWIGSVFQTNCIDALAASLVLWNARGKIFPKERQRIQDWARRIEAPSIARYFEKIMEHVYEAGPRPLVPWDAGSE